MNKEKFYIDDLAPIRAFCLNSDKEDVYKYIYSLQQENQEYRKKYEMAVADYEYEKSKNQNAIEYIENNSLYEEEYDYDYEENLYLAGINDEVAKKVLLEILKEDNKEENL